MSGPTGITQAPYNNRGIRKSFIILDDGAEKRHRVTHIRPLVTTAAVLLQPDSETQSRLPGSSETSDQAMAIRERETARGAPVG